MLLPSNFKLQKICHPYSWENRRVPYSYTTIGPLKEGTRVTGADVWTAIREGGTVYLTSPTGTVRSLNIPEESTDFTFAFDLNGFLSWGVVYGDVVSWHFYDHRVAAYVTETFQGRFPVASLDSIGPRRYPPVDVALVYQVGQHLYVRYQRTRYQEPVYLGEVPAGNRLRSMGMSEDNRWVFKFEKQLPPKFTLTSPEVMIGS